MPEPFWGFQPSGPGWNRSREAGLYPSEQIQWSPAPAYPAGGVVSVTEPGGAMLTRGRGFMNGMGDMFTFPAGASPQAFYEQQIQSGAIPNPAVAEVMDESALYRTGSAAIREGSMPWETAPAPFDLPQTGPRALAPSAAPQAITQMDMQRAKKRRAKAIEAAQAAKVAADNAVRAAAAGAPKVAATNAATAEAAAQVAERVADSAETQQAAAIARSEATKAIAAANVAAQGNGMSGMRDWMELNGMRGGMRDWMELNGMRGLGAHSFMDSSIIGPVKVKHAVYGGLLVGLGYAVKKYFLEE